MRPGSGRSLAGRFFESSTSVPRIPGLNIKPLYSVNHYATVILGLCEHCKTRTVAPFPNWESAEVYHCPVGTKV